jgi:hypothetical protein
VFCFDPSIIPPGFIPIGGCVDSDADFDGVPYRNNTWPGAFRNPFLDHEFHAQPIIFSSPLFAEDEEFGEHRGRKENFSRIAFETDMPRIEASTNPPCQRHLSNPSDPSPGSGCVNPPVGADFYPIYSIRFDESGCRWQEGGPFIVGTLFNFGGNSKIEYGNILALTYPAANGQSRQIYEDFRRILPFNPCPTF